MRPKFARVLLGATIFACAVNASQARGWAAETDINLSSRDREAQKVLKVVVAKEPPPGRCRYDTDWQRAELNDDVARAEFLIPVDAGLTPPSMTGDFRTIIDLDHRAAATAFCTNAELKSYTAERIAEFEAGAERSMQIDRTLFSYPIFNQSRTKAVVIVSRLALDGRFRLPGKIGRHPAGRGDEAQVYRKVGGHWRFLRSHLLGIT